MKKFAVGYINFCDNDLSIEIVEANDVKEAIGKHSVLTGPRNKAWMDEMPDDIEEIKERFFNSDSMIDVVEIE